MVAPPEVEEEGDVVRPGAPPAVAPAPAPAPVITIEQPLEAKEFNQFLDTFMSKAGVSDRRKAAILATRALQNIGLDPTTHLEEAVKGTQFLTSVLNTLPDAGEVTRATKDVVMAQSVSRVGERFMEGPAPEERMERLMQMMMPYIMVMRMASGGDMGGSTSTKSPEVESLKADFSRFREDIKGDKLDRKFDERFQRLELKLEKISERRQPEEEGGMAKKFDELKTALTGSKESEVATKIESLTKALTEKERTSDLDKMSAKVDEMKAGLESKISGLNTSMNQGAEKEDVMKGATDLINSMGNFYKGFGDAAKTMGFEPKDEKMSGDLRKDMLSLGKKALDVVEKSVKYRGGEKPPREQVQQLPAQLPQRVEIPIPVKAPKPATVEVKSKPPAVEKPPAQPAEAPPAPGLPAPPAGLPVETVAPLNPEIPEDIPDKLGLYVPKKPPAPAGKPSGAPKAQPKAPPPEAQKKPPKPQEGR
ncbi:hypothetical protein ES703_00010 [subsurface metagenome]